MSDKDNTTDGFKIICEVCGSDDCDIEECTMKNTIEQRQIAALKDAIRQFLYAYPGHPWAKEARALLEKIKCTSGTSL
jgi:hypothetical protein